MILIKRYANRKLYDTAAGRYITLEDIAVLVRRGEEFQVQDHASGRDLTTFVLMQAVFEEEKRLGEVLPRAVLTRLLQEGEDTLSGLRDKMMAALDPDQHVDDEIRRRLDRLVERGELSAAEGARLAELLRRPPVEVSEPPGSATRAQLDDLSAQLQALEQELERLRKDGSPPSR